MAPRITRCLWCSLHCPLSLELGEEAGRLVYARNAGWTAGALCARGNYIPEFLMSSGRASAAWVRRARRPREVVAFEEAAKAAGEGLKRLVAEHGPGAIAVMAGPDLSLEGMSAVKWFAEEILGGASWSSGLTPADRAAARAAAWSGNGVKPAELAGCSFFLLVGDVFSQFPVISRPILQARYASRRNKVAAVDFQLSPTAELADNWLQARVGTEWAVLAYMLGRFAAGKAEPAEYGALLRQMVPFTEERASEITGVPAEALRLAADLFAAADRAAVCVGGDVAGELCAELAGLLARVAGEGKKLLVIFEAGNAAAAARLDGSAAAEKLLRGLVDGKIKGLVTTGLDPLAQYPSAELEKAMDRLEFTVASDFFYGPATVAGAQVFLPLASWLESGGSYLSASGEWFEAEPLMPPPGLARPAERVIEAMARQVKESAAGVEPPGIPTRTDLERKLRVSPEKITELGNRLARAAKDMTRADEAFPHLLALAPDPLHTHDGRVSRRISWTEQAPQVFVSARDAEAVGLGRRGLVSISSEFAEVRLRAQVRRGLPPGVVAASKAYPEVRRLLGRYAALAGEERPALERVVMSR